MTNDPYGAPSGAPPVSEPSAQAPSTGSGSVPRVKETERPHPVTPLIQGWIILVGIVLYGGREVIENRQDGFDLSDLRWILPVAGGIVLIAGLAGLITWYFTKFVIDDTEVRIETGFLHKTSKKVMIERIQSVDIIQPLAARIFQVAELRIEVGAGDSTIKLRYLTRTKASQLRDFLLARAHGQQATIATSTGPRAEISSVLTDSRSDEIPLAVVSPQRLVGAFFLSSEFLFSALTMVIVLSVTTYFGVVTYALGGIIPLGIALFSMVSRRVFAMFHFTLAESSRGLRITRGLTNLTSQSVPIDRIQGVRVCQTILWRKPDWYRIDIDVVGYGESEGQDNDSSATSVLLPVATAAQVKVALAKILPGVDLEAIEMHPAPRRARVLRWFDWWTLGYGWNERVLVTQHGWMDRTRDIIPHAKTQSLKISQGPWQRRLQLADVYVHTPKGPVNLVAHQLDAGDARALALTQLDRARAARTADRSRALGRGVTGGAGGIDQDRTGEDEVFARVGTDRGQLLGAGGESEVFGLPDDPAHVLRLYRRSHEAPGAVSAQLQALYGQWSGANIGLEIPQIVDIGRTDHRSYTIDRRLSGRSFAAFLADADLTERRIALADYLNAALRLQGLPVPVAGFARLVGEGAPVVFPSLAALLTDQLQRQQPGFAEQLAIDLPQVADVWSRLLQDFAHRQAEPRLVHGDLCPSNAYVSRDQHGRPVVTGVGDFSPHTLAADPLMDVAGAVAFRELETYDGAADDAAWLENLAIERLGAGTFHWIDVYRRYYGFYFAGSHSYDPHLYAWCLRQLRRGTVAP